MEKELKQEFDKELKDIYSLTLTIQAKVFDLMRKIAETREQASRIGSSGEYTNEIKHSEK